MTMAAGRVSAIDALQRTLPRVMVEQGERLGAKPYIVFTHEPARPVTYGGFATVSEYAGSGLAREHGIAAGTVAAVLLPNGGDFVSAWGASLFAGLIDIPVNYEFRKTLLRTALATVGARLVFTDLDGFERLLDPEVREYLPQLGHLILAGPYDAFEAKRRLRQAGAHATTIVAMAELQQQRPPARAWEHLPADGLTSIRYTSGTTGVAKGIMYSHLHLLGRSATHNRVMTLEGGDVLYTPFPLYHGLAGSMGAVGTLQAGATLLGAPRFSASRYWADAHAGGATLGHVLFTLLPMLLQQAPGPADAAHSVRYLYTAWPHREFEARFRTTLIQIFAQSEVGVMAYRRGGTEEGSRCVGKPLPEMELQVVDEIDRPVERGVTGEIVIRPGQPHSVMQGYYNNLPATLRAFRNVWHHTGDSGYLDGNGDLYFLGRIGSTIRRRGVNISSDQIDEEIIRHPGVLECATVGVPSPLGEEDILACIVWRAEPPHADAAVADLLDFLAQRLPRQQMPRYLEFVAALPRTDTGKVRKNALRSRIGHGRTFDREAGSWIAAGPGMIGAGEPVAQS